MKQVLHLLAVSVSCCLLSCNNNTESGTSAVAQKNLDVMHSIDQCFRTKDFSKIGDYIAADAVDHAGEHGDLKGLDSLKPVFAQQAAMINNAKTEFIKELADDEYVMSWEHYTGTMAADGMGKKAGDPIDMKAIEVARFKDGKAVEHWTFMEPSELMKMMGNHMPATNMQADSAKVKK